MEDIIPVDPTLVYSTLSVRRVTIPLPFAYQANALPIELRTVAGVYRYLLITSNGPLLGEFVVILNILL